MADSATLLRGTIEAIKDLSADEFKAAVLAMAYYEMDGIEADDLSGAPAVAYKMYKPIVDKRQAKRTKQSEGGKNAMDNRWGDKSDISSDKLGISSDKLEISSDNRNRNRSKEEEKDISKSDTNVSDCPADEYADVIAEWNALASLGLAPIKLLTDKRRKLLRARLRQYGNDSFNECVEQIRDSDFLQGKHGGKPWQITFDWMILPNNYPKVLEGNYSNRGEPSSGNAMTDTLLNIINGGSG